MARRYAMQAAKACAPECDTFDIARRLPRRADSSAGYCFIRCLCLLSPCHFGAVPLSFITSLPPHAANRRACFAVDAIKENAAAFTLFAASL